MWNEFMYHCCFMIYPSYIHWIVLKHLQLALLLVCTAIHWMCPSCCSLVHFPIHHFLKYAAHVWIASNSEWNSWLVQPYNSTFLNRLCVRCIRHKQLCGRSLHWLAKDSCCVLLPQWQATGRKVMPFYWWLNVCLLKMDLVIIIKLQE